MSIPHRVTKRWKTERYLRKYERSGQHWWNRNAEYEVTEYEVQHWEKWEYLEPDTGNKYTKDVLAKTETREETREINSLH